MSDRAATQAAAPLRGTQLAIISIALALGTFMQVLDTTIANVSLPTIAGNLGASTDQGTWIITSFAVSNGVAVPLTGWLMQRYGAVRTFVTSMLLFTFASFLCGIAWSLPVLVLFRILQGAVHMKDFGLRPSPLERKCRLVIAVGAGRPENQYVWLGHVRTRSR